MQRKTCGGSAASAIRRATNLIWTTYFWAVLVVADAERWAAELLFRRQYLRARSTAQGLVEWSLAAAVLAFVGIAAWQLAGTAITDAINRTIGSLDKAGS
jgi:hypothetical protein